jgi:Predicted rRNA methylase (SpoU class)
MRTCVATNTKLHLIKPLGFSMDDKYLKRSGLDYIQYLDYKIYENWEEFKKENQGECFYLTRYSKKCYSDFDLKDINKDFYFVLGHEHDGIPHDVLKDNLDQCMRIPMTSHVRSLNLSNCAMMIVYHALSQQEFAGLSMVEVQKGQDFLYED